LGSVRSGSTRPGDTNQGSFIMKKQVGSAAILVYIALTVLLAACSLNLCGCGGPGAETPGAETIEPSMKPVEEIPESRKMTYDDVLYGEYATDIALSPDGDSVAWIKDFAEPGMETRASNVFLTGIEDGATRQLTSFTGAQVGGVNWAPDGSKVGFISDAPSGEEEGGAIQVWLAEPDGGAERVTDSETGVEGFDWRDPDTILYTAEVEGEDPQETEPGDDTVKVSDYAQSPVRLFELDLGAGEPTEITDNDDRIIQINVSPDGRNIFYIRTRSKMEEIAQTYSGDIPFKNHLLDLETGQETEVFKQIIRNAGTAWARDSKTIYAVDMKVSDRSLYVYNATVMTRDMASGEEAPIELDWGRGLELMFPFGLPGDPVQPVEDGFLAFMADGCNPKVARFSRTSDGWKKELVECEHQGNIFVMGVSDDGKTICYDHSNASKPPQLYAASLNGKSVEDPVRITELNPDFGEKSFARCETVQWEGALGDPIEGLLFYPSGYEPGRKYPLVLVIHGGPFECDKDRWQTYQWIDPYHILSQKGAFVLAPNYHGSTGYGENSIDFAEKICGGAFYDVVTEDITRGVDWLVELGMVDEGMMGTMGWSCGSIISNALIAADQRYRAASCGAGGAEWVSLWGQSMFGDILVPDLIGADPVEDPDVFKRPSDAPFYDAGRVETPVLMFQPDSDISVAPCMTWITYRGIQKHGEAPVELYIFPGEGHVPGRLAHQRRKMEVEQDWFDEYLFSR
jgi:dipeptidyl aminopeptidase/acylaminoacyl peptidase